MFSGSGKVITSPGWKAVTKGEKDDDLDTTDEHMSLPNISVGDILMPPTYEIETKQTQPPKRFTEGTLLAAMTNIWRFVSPDNPNRERLKECKGIGTPATRDTIISELMEDKSGKGSILPCMSKKNGALQPTAFGECLIDNVDETLIKPDFTAMMEYQLNEIAEGRLSLRSFEQQIVELVYKNIDFAEHKQFRNVDAVKSEGTGDREVVPPQECPVCHQMTLERKYSPKNKAHFWVCSNKECVHPVTKKTIFFADEHKKPLMKQCPTCGTVASRLYSKKTDKYYWHCPKCDEFINDNKDKNKKTKKK